MIQRRLNSPIKDVCARQLVLGSRLDPSQERYMDKMAFKDRRVLCITSTFYRPTLLSQEDSFPNLDTACGTSNARRCGKSGRCGGNTFIPCTVTQRDCVTNGGGGKVRCEKPADATIHRRPRCRGCDLWDASWAGARCWQSDKVRLRRIRRL
jgi:hypothetical protein